VRARLSGSATCPAHARAGGGGGRPSAGGSCGPRHRSVRGTAASRLPAVERLAVAVIILAACACLGFTVAGQLPSRAEVVTELASLIVVSGYLLLVRWLP
jgi:hypothetical protein